MERRRTDRFTTDIPVKIGLRTANSFISGHLDNVSATGAFVRAGSKSLPLNGLTVFFDYRSPCGICFKFALEGRPLRPTSDGVGVEWANSEPPILMALLRAMEVSKANPSNTPSSRQ